MNPQHYALDKGSDQTWQARLDELVETSVADLQKSELVSHAKDGSVEGFASTDYGDIMSKYYIRLSTMKAILALSEKATLREVLELISSAEEIGDLRLRAGEKQAYKKLSEHNDIRFKVAKIEKASDKVFLIIQAVLAGINLNSPEYKTADSQPFLEALAIFRHAPRIARTIVEVAIVKKSGCILRYGMELVRSLTAKAWEDRPAVLRQIEQIGEKSIKVLTQNGIMTLAALGELKPSRIEMLLNRRPPFGDSVIAAVRELPRFRLKITELSVSSSKGKGPVIIELEIQCGLLAGPEQQSSSGTGKKRKSGSLGMTGVLTLTSDNDFVDFRRIPTKALKDLKSFSVTVTLQKPSQTVISRISPDNFAGLTVTADYKPSVPPEEYPTLDTRPASYDVDEILAGLEDDPNFWNMNDSDLVEKKPSDAEETHVPVSPQDNGKKGSPKKKSTKPTIDGQISRKRPRMEADEGPVRLPNGNYACNHTCKKKNQCRHICCREGLPNPPKKSHAPLQNTQPSTKSKAKLPEKGLRQLESLHNKSGSGIPSTQRLKISTTKNPTTNNLLKNRSQIAHGSEDEMDELLDDDDDDLPEPENVVQEARTKLKRRHTISSGSDSDSPPPRAKSTKISLEKKMIPKSKRNHTFEPVSGPSLSNTHTKVTTPITSVGEASTSHTALESANKRRKFRHSPSPILPSPLKPYNREATPNHPHEHYDSPLAIERPAPKRTRLFLPGAASDEESMPSTGFMYDDEPFAFDLNAFDVEDPSEGFSSQQLKEHQITVESARLEPTVFNTRNVTKPTEYAVKNKELGKTVTPPTLAAEEEIDIYGQGLAELNAWLNSGAVEITD
ncbi:hypothetical protein M422DRAFT_779411 [Sphaerobolus stellatus SS14]|uniref:SEC63 domain-containing protein n=1 Tax=Sphaerobolus stellatus (strain SS14) TaxID=990650 RepID=A0A0C9VPZ9_SPHS4|nr:hypothetical protein M422DRAFT_779411 [Sphaerobolus stellatus SS14]